MKDYKQYTDNKIVEFITFNKDFDAFGEIYDRYSLRIYNKSLSIVYNKEIAKDITHDIFLKIFINLKNFKKASKFSTWIYSITYNSCIEYLRKENKLKETDLDNNNSYNIGNYDNNTELLLIKVEKLNEILNEIPPEEKIILLMKYQDGMKIKDIMQVLSIKESAVKMRLTRAKNKVIEIYNNKYKSNE